MFISIKCYLRANSQFCELSLQNTNGSKVDIYLVSTLLPFVFCKESSQN